ncbi:MAG: tyrosine-type recombinase/integrase [Defluviitaleaceae bacterium]|nr:tyrosine-type recombinase/integrase [Defluviitaleaceae bacterium]
MQYKRNKDGYYRETFVVGKKPNGKPDRVIVRDKDLKIFKRKVEEAKRLHARGVSLGNVTVYEWGVRWLTVYKANVSDELKAHFKAKLELDIFPSIGTMPIKDVRASHLQELINGTGKGYGTVVKIRIAIRQLFEAAETEGIIERSPARKLDLPDNLEEEERRPLIETEYRTAWDVAQSHLAGAYVMTMLLCGLRRGECVGLRVANVDFARKRLAIQEAIRYRTNKGNVKDPKTRAGIREVPIPDILLPFMERQCAGKSGDSYVFTKVDGSRATETACKWWWTSFLRQCHLTAGAKTYRNKILIETSPFDDDVSPHYLRHTYSTDLYAAGVDEKAQDYFMGHKSKGVAHRYRKMSDEAFDRAAAMVNEYFTKKYLVRPSPL